MDTKALKSSYKYQLATIESLMKSNIKHCILISPDIDILFAIINLISAKFENSFEHIERRLNVNKKCENTLCLLNINEYKGRQLQKLLYFIFELDEESNFVILYTNRIDCVDTMEKRVRSRFNNEIIHFPLVALCRKKPVINVNLPVPTIQNLKTNEFSKKFNIPILKITDLYCVLSPMHLSLLLLSKLQALDHVNVFEHYSKFVIATPELRKRHPADLRKCYYDLKELKLINKTFSSDWISLKNFITKNSPIFINLLLHKVGK